MREENQQILESASECVPQGAPAGAPEEAPEAMKGAAKQVNEYATAKLSPLLLKFAIPAIIGMIAGGLQNIVNRIYVGQACGSTALAGVQIGFPVMSVFMALSMLLGMGSMTLISIRLGQGRKESAEQILGQATLLLFAIPLIAMAILQPNLDTVLRFIGASEDVLPYAHDYFRIFIVGMIFFSLSAGLNNIIRAQGAPLVAMGTQILACLINVVVNYLFVIRFGWGVQGAALGILIGNFLSLFWIFGYFAKKTSYLKVRFKNMRIFPHELKAVLGLGLSPFLIQLAASLQQFVQNMALTNYGGDAAISALAICGSLSALLLFPMIGFTQGGSPIMGYNYGAGNYDRIKGTLYRAMAFGTIFAVISWTCVMLWAEGMVGLFISGEPEVEALSAHALRVFLFGLPFIPVGMCGGALFQSTGKIFRSMFLSLIRQFFYYIPLMLLLPIWFGLDGCWLAGPVSDIGAFITTIIFVYFGLKSIKREMEEKGVGDLVA